MKKTLSFVLNEKPVLWEVDARKSLLEVLREHGFTGTKEGCGVGECGACTVLVDDAPVNACLFLALWVEGRRVRTVEGEAKEGRLSRVQQAYLDAGAVQCGFCTPGFVMATTAFVEGQRAGEVPTREAIRRAHAGNLCRCTGYEAIVRAVETCLEKKTPPEDPAACDCG